MHKFNHDFSCILAIFAVSLFTREWIEIQYNRFKEAMKAVSLFTREWIEIHGLWGKIYINPVSLFTREWIEIAKDSENSFSVASPSLRGSGLKSRHITGWHTCWNTSPSLRGSGLK